MRENFHTDPAHFPAPERNPQTRIVLGLDLGTCCGYSISLFHQGDDPKNSISPRHMGQFDLSAGPHDSGAIRFVRLRHFLSAIRPDAIFYEDVKNVPTGVGGMPVGVIIARAATAAELLGAFKATVCTWAEENRVPCTGFGIGVIKKRATGKGNAGKPDMIKACNESFGANLEVEGYETTGVDNIADSSWVLLLGLEQYGLGLFEETKVE